MRHSSMQAQKVPRLMAQPPLGLALHPSFIRQQPGNQSPISELQRDCTGIRIQYSLQPVCSDLIRVRTYFCNKACLQWLVFFVPLQTRYMQLLLASTCCFVQEWWNWECDLHVTRSNCLTLYILLYTHTHTHTRTHTYTCTRKHTHTHAHTHAHTQTHTHTRARTHTRAHTLTHTHRTHTHTHTHYSCFSIHGSTYIAGYQPCSASL